MNMKQFYLIWCIINIGVAMICTELVIDYEPFYNLLLAFWFGVMCLFGGKKV